MGCFTSISGSDALSSNSLPPSIQETKERTYGKVTMLNSDGSVVAAGTIVPVGERTQLHGRIRMNPVLKIKSDEDNNMYDQAVWIAKCARHVKHKSVYASDPEAAKAYVANVQKANDAAAAAAAARNAPRTPRPVVPPVQRTVFSMRQPPPSNTLELLSPLPFKFDLPSLPSMITPPRLV